MSTTSKRNRVVTERDERLFRYLYLNKVATIDQIRRDVFENCCRQVVHRRLSKLIDSKLLEVIYLREKGNRTVFSLSQRSFKDHIGEKRDMARLQRKSQAIHHDLALVEIRNRLLKFSVVKSYITENGLQSGLFDDNPKVKAIRELNPDAIIELSLEGETLFLPLEFERSAKFSRRYDTLLSRYYRNSSVQAVLFISDSNSIQKRVMQTEKRIAASSSPKFFYLTIDELLSETLVINFKNIQKEILPMTRQANLTAGDRSLVQTAYTDHHPQNFNKDCKL